jgi:hypothetical protein
MLVEYSTAVRLDLTEGNGSHPSSLESKAETSNAAEEIEDIQSHAPTV